MDSNFKEFKSVLQCLLELCHIDFGAIALNSYHLQDLLLVAIFTLKLLSRIPSIQDIYPQYGTSLVTSKIAIAGDF